MTVIPQCPQPTKETRNAVNDLRAALEREELLLQPPRAAEWDAVVEQWAVCDALPLIARRSGHPEMCMELPMKGRLRKIVPSDNSPAHWLIIQCFAGVEPSLGFVTEHLKEIPMTMRMGKTEAAGCDYPRTLDSFSKGKQAHAGARGWYLAHINPVGLGKLPRKVALGDHDYAALQNHFRLFMKPSNMTLISSDLAGLAEIEGWLGLAK